MKRFGFLREVLFFAFFLFLSVLNTWPLSRNLQSAVWDPGDPFLTTWFMEWDWWATTHRPLSLFHAPIFHPARYALAFSEHIYGIAMPFFPLYAAGMRPLTVHGVAMLAGFAFCGYGAFVLARTVTKTVLPSMAAGIFFAFVPFRFTHLGHLQHIWSGWLAILLAALLYYFNRPTWKRAVLFGGAFLMNGLTNMHWFLFGSLALLVTAAFLLLTEPTTRTRRFLVPIAACTAAAMLLLLPFLLPYAFMSKLYQIERTPFEAELYSAHAADWLITAPPNKLYGDLPIARRGSNERWLFPGVLGMLFGAAGLVLVRKQGRVSNGQSHPADRSSRFSTARGGRVRTWFRSIFPGAARGLPDHLDQLHAAASIRVAVIWVILGFVCSLGMWTVLYRFLFDYVFVFRSIRVPARAAMLTYVGLSILIAVGILVLLRGLPRGARSVAAAGICVLFLVELRAAPIRWHLALPETPPVYEWIRQAPFRGSVLELPMGVGTEAEYVLRSTAHHRPLINGVSGYFPEHHQRLRWMLSTDSVDGALINFLETLQCSIVVVHNERMNSPPAIRSWIQEQLSSHRLSYVGRFEHGVGGDYVFAVLRTEPDAEQTLRRPEKWDPSGMTPWEKRDAFLSGRFHLYNESVFGWLESPAASTDIHGQLQVSGWAFSPHGISAVNLRFENGAVVIPADLRERKEISEIYPWYAKTERPGFIHHFADRPKAISRDTDLQVEIIDGAGNRTLLRQVMLRWLP